VIPASLLPSWAVKLLEDEERRRVEAHLFPEANRIAIEAGIEFDTAKRLYMALGEEEARAVAVACSRLHVDPEHALSLLTEMRKARRER
jgi:hypothetical protein